MPASSRAIAAVTADSSRHRFIVGTCALGGLPSTAAGVESSAAAPTAGGGAAPGDKGAPPAGRKRQPNEVHLIELNEELNEVECVQIWPHAAGEVWSLAPSPDEATVFGSVYGEVSGGGGWERKGALWRVRASGGGGGGGGGAEKGSVVTGVVDASRGDGGRPIRVGDRVLALQGQNTLRWTPAQLQLALAETDPPMSLLFAASDATAAQVAAALVKAEREREAHADESVMADGTFKVRFDVRPLGIALTASDSGKAGVSVGAVHRRVPPVRVGDLLLAVNGFKVVSWSVEKLVDELDDLPGSLTLLFARPEISRADLARAAVKSEKAGRHAGRDGADAPAGKGRTAGTYEYTVKSLPLGITFKDLGGTTGASVGHVTRGFTPIVPGDLVASVNGQSVASWSAKKVSEHVDALKPPIKVLFATPDISTIELAVAIKHANAPKPAPSGIEAGASHTGDTKQISRAKSVVLIDV